jgi:hypothetical protein
MRTGSLHKAQSSLGDKLNRKEIVVHVYFQNAIVGVYKGLECKQSE